MLTFKTKNGLNCLTPSDREDDPTPHFTVDQIDNALSYYQENGYVVINSLLTRDQCKHLMNVWQKEVKSYDGYIYRQATAQLETNVFNDKGFVMNPILNLQSLNLKSFQGLRLAFEQSVICNRSLAKVTGYLLGEKPKIVQSMYFEGNSATWEHQDSYYLDDEIPGLMTAGWIALEDIASDAGRFFVCPKSHLQDYSAMNLDNNIATNHAAYISSIIELVKHKPFEVKAPRLKQGDVLFWSSMTIHGSLDTVDSINSRSSITFHAIRASSKLNVHRTSLRDVNVSGSSPFDVFRPKDQMLKRNRLIFLIASRFPRLFYAMKKLAITYLISAKR